MAQNGMPGPEKKDLTLKQRKAALFLAQGNTMEQAAQQVGAGLRTVNRWKEQPEFLAAIKACEDDLYSESLAKLKQYTGAAIETMYEIMNSKKVAPYVRLGAANSIADKGIEVHRSQVLEQRLQELEEMVRGNGQ